MKEQIASRIASINWYHTIHLPKYGHTEGAYDHETVWSHYGFPKQLNGLRVLDVGAGDGFFTFRFEELGARVTALNPHSWHEEDFSLMRAEEWRSSHAIEQENPFLLAASLRGSSADLRSANIYDLDPEVLGTFDLVFCGSVLCHLMDPMRALRRLRGVTRGRLVLATIVVDAPDTVKYAQFEGAHTSHTFWIPTIACLRDMMLVAGYTEVEHVSTFDLRSAGNPSAGGLHAVMHGCAEG